MPAASPLVLALDQGSHASRAVVFDNTGQVVAAHHADVTSRYRNDVEVEQDPDEVVDSIERCVESMAHALGERKSQLRAVGLATQRASIVCWDRTTGEALSPVISWQDRRSHREIDALAPHADAIARRTGLRLSPHYGASKLRWCLVHLPAVQQAQAQGRLCLGPLASFLACRLLREHTCIADPANAARTLLWNADHGEWDAWLCSLFDVPREALPVAAPTVGELGQIIVDGQSVPLCCLTGDQPAALFAFGEPEPGTFYCNIGTGAFIQALLPAGCRVPDGLLRSVAFDDGQRRLNVLEGTVNGAGAAITWAVKSLGTSDDFGVLDAALSEAGDVPLFINGIGGLGAPYWLPELRSRYVGEGAMEEKLAAVAESIVFLIATIVTRMREVLASPTRLLVTGGLSTMNSLCQRLADVTGLSVERPSVHEATVRGVAFLAAERPVRWNQYITSAHFRPQAHAALRARYARWQQAMTEATGTSP